MYLGENKAEYFYTSGAEKHFLIMNVKFPNHKVKFRTFFYDKETL